MGHMSKPDGRGSDLVTQCGNVLVMSVFRKHIGESSVLAGKYLCVFCLSVSILFGITE